MAEIASKTLLVTNLPSYVKYEEFERLFTQLQGCSSCQMAKANNGQLFGVLEFLDIESAALARSIYNGFQGWGLPGLYIHAPPLTFPNKRPLDAGPEAGPSKQARTSGPNTGNLAFYGGQDASGVAGNQGFQLSGDYGAETYLNAAPDGLGSGQFQGDAQYQDMGGEQDYNGGFELQGMGAEGFQNGFYGSEEVAGQLLAAPVTPDQPAPNPTLYITGLPADITKRELAHVFRPFLGFLSVRLLRPQGNKQAGVASFDTAENSAHACTTLAGYPMDLDDPNNFLLSLNFARPAQPRNREGGGGRMSGPSFPGRSPRGGGRGGGGARGNPSGRGGPPGGREERGLLGSGPGPMPMGSRGPARGPARGGRGSGRGPPGRHAGGRGDGGNRGGRSEGPGGAPRARGRGPSGRGGPPGRTGARRGRTPGRPSGEWQ